VPTRMLIRACYARRKGGVMIMLFIFVYYMIYKYREGCKVKNKQDRVFQKCLVMFQNLRIMDGKKIKACWH